MPILSLDHLILAEQKGLIRVSDRLDFNPFSLDIRLGTLYRHKEDTHIEKQRRLQDDIDETSQEYIDRFLEEVSMPKDGMIVTPDDFFLWQPKETIALSAGISADIASRSSYARLGLMAQSVDDDLRDDRRARKFRPLITLKPLGASVLIKPEEPLAQIIFRTDPGYVTKEEMKELISQEEFQITRREQTTTPLSNLTQELKQQIDELGAMVLTIGPTVKIYNGKTLIPGKDNTGCFDTAELRYDRPLRLPKRTFYISASEESVSIPESYIGKVSEGSMISSLQRFRQTGHKRYAPLPLMAHPNAPNIGPKNVFKGVITFENVVMGICDGRPCTDRQVSSRVDIYRGMRQSYIYLERLSCPVSNPRESRYKGQSEATLCKF
ncbi:MAG: 2'-deoxycytidine 5'-triphosphate deaminase [Nanoarchaeota archaeon]